MYTVDWAGLLSRAPVAARRSNFRLKETPRHLLFASAVSSPRIGRTVGCLCIHIGCDDEHAETLEKMTCSYFHEPDWFNTCERAMDYALTLRQRFFENLLEALPHQRVKPLISSVQSEAAPSPAERGAGLDRAGVR
jgi:hypothetical protein